ncbi:hypothetical protein ACQKMV_12575 [Lysinibacillus sp. NPDC094403]|uniref:hypothetical protein n=1 Tax=Lysinibacillus sp. NPDC094403 TaxID=3390581 RepID=UPI003D081AFB
MKNPQKTSSCQKNNHLYKQIDGESWQDSKILWELCNNKYAQMLHKVMLDKWRLTMKQNSTIINTLIEHDLTIEKMLEPLPDS